MGRAVFSWCDLSLAEKVLIMLGVAGGSLDATRLAIYIFIADKVFLCDSTPDDSVEEGTEEEGKCKH